jgi:colicin import membrane protein
MNTTSEKRENSVLFSLRELKGLEDDRVREEDERQKQVAAAAEQARLAEIERARREAEQARAASESAERERLAASERQQREDGLRLEEAERRARVEAQSKLESERLRLEMEARVQVASATKKPTGLIALAAVLVVAVAGVGIFAYQKSVESDNSALRAQDAAERAAAAKAAKEQADRDLLESKQIQAELQTQLDKAVKLRAAARTADEQAAADETIKRLQSKKAEATRNIGKPATAAPKLMICPQNKPICDESEKVPAGQ